MIAQICIEIFFSPEHDFEMKERQCIIITVANDNLFNFTHIIRNFNVVVTLLKDRFDDGSSNKTTTIKIIEDGMLF